MDQNILALPRILDPLVGGLEGMRRILGLAIVKVEFKVDKVLGVGEVQINTRAYSTDIVLLQFTNIVCKLIPADPNFSQISFFLEHLLSWVIISSKWEHLI